MQYLVLGLIWPHQLLYTLIIIHSRVAHNITYQLNCAILAIR